MRHARRVDKNQEAIVKVFRGCGASVEVLSDVGRGVPDLLVGFRGITLLVEVKSEKGKLTVEQRNWNVAWSGSTPIIVRSIDDALAIMNHHRM